MTVKTKRTPQQIGKASKAKGARFELEISHYLQAHGYPLAHRTAQHCGKTGDAGDVEGIPGLHVECKRVEKLNLYSAYQQAVRDSSANGNGNIPVVIHKKNREETLVTLSLDNFIQIYSADRNGGEKGDF
jgi:Holliday junction resolvase